MSKTLTVEALNGSGTYFAAIRLVGVSDGIEVWNLAGLAAGGGYAPRWDHVQNTLVCKLTAPGQVCSPVSPLFNWTGTMNNGQWTKQTPKYCAQSTTTPNINTVCRFIPEWANNLGIPCYGNPQNGRICRANLSTYWVDWSADGSIQVFAYYANTESGDTWVGGPFGRSRGSISRAQMQNAPASSTVRLTGGVVTGQ